MRGVAERPTVRYEDLGGIEAILQDIRELIEVSVSVCRSPVNDYHILWVAHSSALGIPETHDASGDLHSLGGRAPSWYLVTWPPRLRKDPLGALHCRST